jgi:hypothetical protein
MAKILFIQLQQVAFPGLYYICDAVKAAGHTYDVIATNDSRILLHMPRCSVLTVLVFPI